MMERLGSDGIIYEDDELQDAIEEDAVAALARHAVHRYDVDAEIMRRYAIQLLQSGEPLPKPARDWLVHVLEAARLPRKSKKTWSRHLTQEFPFRFEVARAFAADKAARPGVGVVDRLKQLKLKSPSGRRLSVSFQKKRTAYYSPGFQDLLDNAMARLSTRSRRK